MTGTPQCGINSSVERTGNPKGTEDRNPIRVLLADDHTEFRHGLAEMLLTDDNIEVVGEAQDGAGAIEIAERVRPDVAVLDLAMPTMEAGKHSV
jgi:chemotaxis response regulator CheB